MINSNLDICTYSNKELKKLLTDKKNEWAVNKSKELKLEIKLNRICKARRNGKTCSNQVALVNGLSQLSFEVRRLNYINIKLSSSIDKITEELKNRDMVKLKNKKKLLDKVTKEPITSVEVELIKESEKKVKTKCKCGLM